MPLSIPVAAAVGAAVGAPVGLWLVLAPIALAVWWARGGRTVLAWLAAAGAVGLMCTSLSAAAWNGLDRPLPSQIDARVELVKDPRPVVRGVRVQVRHQGVHYDAFARGASAGALVNLRAGETVEVMGRVTPRDPSDRWRASRHVAGLIDVDRASRPARASGPWAVANAIHRAMGEGARDLPAAQRGVLLGVSVGDRAAMPAAVADDLRAAGLSHLTAVSGQHVALLLAMLAPVMRRIPVRPRTMAVVAVLAGFVVLTRGEPSVLRAVGMAVAVELARSGGQQVRGVRVLGLIVTVLLVIDPLLIWSVAFQLSVTATLGIALGASRVATRVPGPRYVANLVAMGVCAQLAVAPLAVAYFGQVPVTGVIANVLVAPVVGLMMGWGLSVGVVAGLLGVGSSVVHVPTVVLGGWLVSVAGWFASLPAGQARPLHVGVVAVSVGVVMVAGRRGWAWVRRGCVGIVVITLFAAVVLPQGPPVGRHVIATGAEVLVGGEHSVVVIDGRADIAMVLSGLRRRGVVRVALVISRTGSSGSVGVATQVCDRLGPCAVLVPETDPGGASYPMGAAQSGPDADADADADPDVDVVTGLRTLDVGGRYVVIVNTERNRLTVELAGPTRTPGTDTSGIGAGGVGAAGVGASDRPVSDGGVGSLFLGENRPP